MYSNAVKSCHLFSINLCKVRREPHACLCAQSLQSCPTLCEHVDGSPPGSSVHGDSPGKNPGVGCRVLLQGIFLTQGSKLRLLHLLHCNAGEFFTTRDTREAPTVVTVLAYLSLLKPSFPLSSMTSGSLGFLLCLAISVTLAGSFLSTQSFYLSLY